MAGKIGNPRFFHELGIAAQYAASVNGGLNTAAAQFFNFRDTAAVQRFPVGFLKAFTDGMAGCIFSKGGPFKKDMVFNRLMMDANHFKNALGQGPCLIHDNCGRL